MPDSVAVQISIDRDIKEKAVALFFSLALDMSCAVDMFLHRCASGKSSFSSRNAPL